MANIEYIKKDNMSDRVKFILDLIKNYRSMVKSNEQNFKRKLTLYYYGSLYAEFPVVGKLQLGELNDKHYPTIVVYDRNFSDKLYSISFTHKNISLAFKDKNYEIFDESDLFSLSTKRLIANLIRLW